MARNHPKPPWLLVFLLLTSNSLNAQPGRHPDCKYPTLSTDRWYSFKLGDLSLDGMPPASVRKLGKDLWQGYDLERIELTASRANFSVAGSALQGKLTDIYICGSYLHVQGEERPRLKIPRGGLIMTLRSQLSPIKGFYGGQLVLPRQRTWLTNRTEILINPTSRSGEIVFEMHPVRLQGLSIQLPVVGKVTTNAVSRPKPHPDAPTGGPEFVFNMTDNSLQLTDGDFDVDVEAILRSATNTFATPAHWLQIASAKATGALLAFHQNVSQFTVSDIALTVKAIANHGDEALTAIGRLSIGSLRGTSGPNAEQLRLGESSLQNASFEETPGQQTCDTLVDIDDDTLHSLGLDAVRARRKAAAGFTQLVASSQPQIYATLPLPPLQKAIEAALPAALQGPQFSTCPSEIVATGGLSTKSPEGAVEFGLRISHQFVLGDLLTASRTVEGAALRAAKPSASLTANGLLGWLEGQFAEALATLGPIPAITMNAPFSIRPTVSIAAWGGRTLSGTVANSQTKALGKYNLFMDKNGAHVLGGLQ